VRPERFQRVRKLFDKALELAPEERQAFLEESCPDDPEVRAEVQKLLRQHDVDEPLRTADASTATAPTEDLGAARGNGRRIGPFLLRREIGEGGMGVVYEALQERPVRRVVALKVIKRGMDTRHVIARFESERQALAMMNHPCIAKVLDAGADDQGRPYFAMEFIQGVPITDYCDRHNLTTRERMELMIQVCEGVQHAHQKGIIHRDIKPSNILVEIQDEKPVPKIIDFGVAKAISQELTERTMFTEYGQIIGTPEYMSPEQAEMTGLDVDTRADVYSLGVLLYELLIGALPFDSRQLRKKGYDEIRRVIREETPHGADPDTLVRLCRGDLDWITMKALDKDRTHRYASASELSADLRHHMNDEPVSAGPPSVGYRTRKFVRRHRVGVTVSAALAAMFVVGFVGTAYGLVRAIRAEKQARLEAETVSRVSDFMFEMFEINDPGEARGNEVTAREILDRGAARIRAELGQRPGLQGRLMESMGGVYRSLGLYDAALPLLEEAVQSYVRANGEMHAEVAGSLNTLAGLLILRGRAEEALPLLERAARIQEQVLEANDPERARTLNNLGGVHRRAGRYDDALEYYLRALQIRERALGPDHPDVAKMLSNVGLAQMRLGDMESAKQALERSLAIREQVLGPDHPDLAKVLNSIAQLHRKSEEYDLARRAVRRALAIQEKTLSDEHPDLVYALVELGLVEKLDGNLPAARQALERAVAIGEMTGHGLLVPAIQQLIEVSRQLGDTARASELEAKLAE
jgi:tetratricopeptide (TPR) repeat protein/predicted Ser/Thr protein kinase